MAKEITASFVWECIAPRPASAHKGSFGRALLVAGSRRYRGAAALCAEGALRGGAGLLTLATVESAALPVLCRLPECMCLPCPETSDGVLDGRCAERLLQFAQNCQVLAVGPGLGNNAETSRLVRVLTAGAPCPVVLDADALNAAAALDSLPACPQPLVLTPHPAEMARLTGLSVAEVESARESIAAGYARANGCVVVLKGHRTLVAGPDGQMLQNRTGNPGLARGGSGDILTGLLAAMLAQGLPALQAAACAVYLHGAAADLCAARLGQTGMLPHDLFADLGRLFAQNGR